MILIVAILILSILRRRYLVNCFSFNKNIERTDSIQNPRSYYLRNITIEENQIRKPTQNPHSYFLKNITIEENQIGKSTLSLCLAETSLT